MSYISSLDSTSVLTGIFSSLIASLLWVFILFRVRPHISISPMMAIDTDPKTGENVYVFKVKNNSSLLVGDNTNKG
jgi:hypothetical protein